MVVMTGQFLKQRIIQPKTLTVLRLRNPALSFSVSISLCIYIHTHICLIYIYTYLFYTYLCKYTYMLCLKQILRFTYNIQHINIHDT